MRLRRTSPPTPYLTIREAAGELGISRRRTRELIREGKLRAIRDGTLIPRPAFDAYRRRTHWFAMHVPTPGAMAGEIVEAVKWACRER